MRTSITLLLLTISTLLAAQGVVINEFVASNDSTSMIPDDFGEYDDWVELYNNSTTAVDLGGYFFSDDIAEPDKWTFPAGVTIDGNGYLIVWTDSDDEQGDLHTSFKLSKSGEALILSDNAMMVLDSITFGQQETNVSMARIPNGTGDFTPRAPSYGVNNDDGVFVTALNVRKDFVVYPNPASTAIQLDFTKTNGNLSSAEAIIQVTDVSGKLVLSQAIPSFSNTSIINIDISNLTAGIHFIKVETASDVFLKKLMVE